MKLIKINLSTKTLNDESSYIIVKFNHEEIK